MPVYRAAGGHEVNVSGKDEIARFEANPAYAEIKPAKPSEPTSAKKAAAKPSEK